MCGINGIYRKDLLTDKDKHLLYKMNAEMHYRGPDENDVWISGNIGLAHTRLSIIGVNNGHQPIFSEDDSITTICNGEIYNYKELRADLIRKGHHFSTDSDSEVIIHLYEDKGTSLLNDLRGMFAFALWDKNTNQLFLARDRSGKKPLYYYHDYNKFVFSSELKTINRYVLKKTDLDYSILRQAAYYSYPVDLENTHIKQIKRLKPGEYSIISNSGFVKEKYWEKINTYSYPANYEDAKIIVKEILQESVKIRLRSDVPIAILLSSGVDSSAIACLASMSGINLHAITVGYNGMPYCDEREPAKKLCKEFGIQWHNLELSMDDYETYFEEYVDYIDEPVCDISAIAQWGIYKKAKDMGFTVLLSGNGSDELFYGYEAHNQSAENISLINDMKLIYKNNSNPLKLFSFILNNCDRFIKLLRTYTPYPLNHKFVEQMKKLDFQWPDNTDSHDDKILTKYLAAEKYPIEGIYKFLFNVWLQSNCYYLSDRLGMGNSLEIRAPFSDHVLVDFVSSLPLHLKYNPKSPKGLLKDALIDVLPDYILKPPKKGFTPPAANIDRLISEYNPKFFDKKLNSYNQVIIDKLLINQT